jgi:hypothetical protein
LLIIDAEFSEKHGAFITALVGVSKPHENALRSADYPLPSLQEVRLLIDTGATGTCIDESVLANLEIAPSGFEELASASRKNEYRNTYDISLWIPDRDNNLWIVSRCMRVMESNSARLGFTGLLGRNVIARGSLLFDGLNKAAQLTLSLPREK